METTKNNLSPYEKTFFNKMNNYIDLPIYFFGSIQRDDYIPNSSDIDIMIFTDNIKSTVTKIQCFLNNTSGNVVELKKFIIKSNNTNELVNGFKILYEEPENNFSTEFSIYEEKNKEYILNVKRKQIFLPFYASWLLIILKFFYYTLNILPKDWFKYLKDKILHELISVKSEYYVAL